MRGVHTPARAFLLLLSLTGLLFPPVAQSDSLLRLLSGVVPEAAAPDGQAARYSARPHPPVSVRASGLCCEGSAGCGGRVASAGVEGGGSTLAADPVAALPTGLVQLAPQAGVPVEQPLRHGHSHDRRGRADPARVRARRAGEEATCERELEGEADRTHRGDLRVRLTHAHAYTLSLQGR